MKTSNLAAIVINWLVRSKNILTNDNNNALAKKMQTRRLLKFGNNHGGNC